MTNDNLHAYNDSGSGGSGDVVGAARHLADTTKEEASDFGAVAAAKASEVKDVALDRGEDVAEVAKEELGRLADDTREQLQNLWEQASAQLRDQATAGRQQLADLLHDLAGELGQMASKSDQNGPVTAFAKQVSRRGGELSHWLGNAESADVLTEIRRFARRRPIAFLAGATVAGVVVGRLSRGLMAGRNTVASAGATRPTTTTSVPAPRPAAEVPAHGAGTAGQTYGYDTASSPSPSSASTVGGGHGSELSAGQDYETDPFLPNQGQRTVGQGYGSDSTLEGGDRS
jgi:hypothetical protein